MDVVDQMNPKRSRRGRPGRGTTVTGFVASSARAVALVAVGCISLSACGGPGAASADRDPTATGSASAGAGVNFKGETLTPKAQEIACTWLFGPASNRPTIAVLTLNYADLSEGDAKATVDYVVQFMPVALAYVPADVEPALVKWGDAWAYASTHATGESAVKLGNAYRSVYTVAQSCAAAGFASQS